MPQCTGSNGPPPNKVCAASAFVGPEVNVAPGGMVRTHFEHHQVERPEARADLAVFGGRAGVATEKYAMARATG